MKEYRGRKYKLSFILDHPLMHYRVPFFHKLGLRGYDVIVMHSGDLILGDYSFQQVKVPAAKFAGLEIRHLPTLRDTDIVVCMQNLRVLNLWILTFNPVKSYKLIHWGIGASSAKGLRSNKTIMSRLRNTLANFASAQILYSQFPLPLFSKTVRSKTFVAHNTIDNPLSVNLSSYVKNSILFIGSLNKRKRVDILIQSFLVYLEKYRPKRITRLNIIGEGSEMQELSNLIDGHPFRSQIKFVGRIEDGIDKIEFFKTAAICVSPKQAGLSVLESYSFGVPFIAFKDCISGGEHLNIIDGSNGFLIESEAELIAIFKHLEDKPSLVRELGHNAFNHYKFNRKMDDMIDSFESAFDYVLRN